MPKKGRKLGSSEKSVSPRSEASVTRTDESSDFQAAERVNSGKFMEDSTGRRVRVDRALPRRSSAESWESISAIGNPTDEERVTPSSRDETTARTDASMTAASSVAPRSVSFRETATYMPTRGRKRVTGGRRQRGRSFVHVNEEWGLFDAILKDPTSLERIVNSWAEKYNADEGSAVLMLLQLLVDSSRAKFRLTPAMLASMDFKEMVRRMTEEDEDDNYDYPLTASGRWKDFDRIFGEFLTTFTRRSQKFIVDNDSLMDGPLTFLAMLSHSQIRAYRHTATFAAMKFMVGFAEIAAGIEKERANIRRQHDTERRKDRGRISTARLETLEERMNEIVENAAKIDVLLDYLLSKIFAPRCLDVASEIRVQCIDDFVRCAMKHHERFLQDGYLSHVDDRLYDDEAEVRLNCLEALQLLYEHESCAPRLVYFSRTIKSRVVAMTCDKDYDVARRAVGLVHALGKLYEDILEEEDVELVYKLVYSANRGVACAAGKFVNERLFRPDASATVPNAPVIRDIVTFFIESELPEHAVFLVDALIETNETLNDWECMTDLLLGEVEPGEEALADEHETRLVEIMYFCVKQSTTGEGPMRREASRKVNSAKWIERIRAERRKMTEHFIGALPLLLERYRADSEKIAFLVALPRYFDLEVYTTSRREEHLEGLLRLINEAVEEHNHPGISGNAAKSLEVMCNEQLAIYPQCDIARSLTLDHVHEQYRRAIETYSRLIDESRIPDDDTTRKILESLRKLVIFCSVHDTSTYDNWDSLWKILEDARFGRGSLPDEAVVRCTQACYSTITRSQVNIIKLEDSSLRVINEANRLTARLHSFMDLMMHFVGGDANVSAASSAQVVREEAYCSICDMLVYFGNTLLAYPNPVVHQLIYTADSAMQKALNRFVEENVFGDRPNAECSIEERHKRRRFLGGICKLAKCGVVPLISIADVFKHYVEYHEMYGDIMKDAVALFRERNRTSCALLLLRSLEILYAEKRAEANGDDKVLSAAKMLAKRFALLFGLDATKNRDAFIALHLSGFAFATASSDMDENDPAMPPKNLTFLEILVEFSAKLDEADKAKVLSFVEENFPQALPMLDDVEWKALRFYRHSLMPGRVGHGAIRKKRTGARRKTKNAEGDEGTDQIAEKPGAPPVSGIARPTGAPGTSTWIEGRHTAVAPDFSMTAIEDPIQDTDWQTRRDDRLFEDATE